MGKTLLIEKLIGRYNVLNHTYFPIEHKTGSMANFDSQVHKFIVFERFRIFNYNMELLIRLCDSHLRPQNFPSTNGNPKGVNIYFKGPIIFMETQICKVVTIFTHQEDKFNRGFLRKTFDDRCVLIQALSEPWFLKPKQNNNKPLIKNDGSIQGSDVDFWNLNVAVSTKPMKQQNHRSVLDC